MNFNTDLEGGMEGGKKEPKVSGSPAGRDPGTRGGFQVSGEEGEAERDSQSDSGYVSSKPGYGWESDNRHLAYDASQEREKPDSKEVRVPVSEHPRTPVMSPAAPAPSVESRDSRSTPSWPFWWLLFILLILAIGATVGFSIWDTKLVRDDYFQSERTLHGRIDSTDAQSQNRLQERATAIEQRLNDLSQRVSDLQSENAALRAKLESTQVICQQSCTNDTTK